MSHEPPTRAPTKLETFARLEWTRTFDDYDPADWSISAHFDGPGSADSFTITPTEADGTYTFSKDTDELAAGLWNWQMWATSTGSEGRHVIERGTLELVAGLFGGGTDAGTTTHAIRMVELIEARLEGRLPLDAERYTIAGRSLDRIPIAELRELRRTYLAEARSDAQALKSGRSPGVRRRIAVTF